MLDRLEFLLNEAFVSFRRNKWITFAAITTSAMALFIIGGFAFAYFGLASFASNQESKFDINVFARVDASPEQVQALGKRLEKLDGVKAVTFRSKAEVWKAFQKENPEISSGLEIENPMPDTFNITFSDLKKAKDIVAYARKMPEVAPKDGVQYMGDVQALIEQVMSAIRWLGLVLGTVMLATGGILIYNTIRLTMVARKKEMRIMELVGATRQTVWTPLIIEGVAEGVMGALLATAVLWIAHSVVAKLLESSLSVIKVGTFPLLSTAIVLCLSGAAYGLVCSYLAIRERPTEELPR